MTLIGGAARKSEEWHKEHQEEALRETTQCEKVNSICIRKDNLWKDNQAIDNDYESWK